MTPIHHPACNFRLGPPLGMAEEQVRTLHCYRDEDSISSFWVPEPQELEHLLLGGSVMLRCMGGTHPPLSLRVSPAGEQAAIGSPPQPQYLLTSDEFIALRDERDSLLAWQKNEFDSSDDALFNVRRLRSRVLDLEHQLQTCRKNIMKILGPVADWYQPDDQPDRPWQQILSDIVADLQTDRDAALTLGKVRHALEKIVVTTGEDSGVILLSDESPTHQEIVNGNPVNVYNHDHFSPLGDALVALHRLATNDRPTKPTPD